MNPHRATSGIVLATALAFATVGGAAAQREPAKTDEAPTVAPAAVPSNAPFMKPMARLATILGSVSFLRQLCGDENASAFRARMDDLIRFQSPNAADREILVASFNSGYRSFASVYRRCTPAARVAVARYQEEGAALGRDIATRHGN